MALTEINLSDGSGKEKSHAPLQTHKHTHTRACDSWAFLSLAVRYQSRVGTVGAWRGGGGPDWRVAGIIRAELKLPKEQPIVRPPTAGRATASGVGPVRHASDETSTRFHLRVGAQDKSAGFPSAGGTSGGASEGFLQAFIFSGIFWSGSPPIWSTRRPRNRSSRPGPTRSPSQPWCPVGSPVRTKTPRRTPSNPSVSTGLEKRLRNILEKHKLLSFL